MKVYELAYLMSSEATEEEIQTFNQKVVSFVSEEGGEIAGEARSERKKLFYPVKGQRQVHLISLSFRLNPENLDNLRKKIKSENQILRFAILTKAVPSLLKKPARKRREKREFEPRVNEIGAAGKRETGQKEGKVEMEEIEKKLAEILGEI